MPARSNAQQPPGELDLPVVVQRKVRRGFVAMPARAAQAKVHNHALEPRHERAAGTSLDRFRFVRVVEPAVPVAACTAAAGPGVAVVRPRQVLLQLQVVVLQPEHLHLERIGLSFLRNLQRLVFAAQLKQPRIQQHPAHKRKPLNALHGSPLQQMEKAGKRFLFLPSITNKKTTAKKFCGFDVDRVLRPLSRTRSVHIGLYIPVSTYRGRAGIHTPVFGCCLALYICSVYNARISAIY
jgi:hypothetical protein